MTNFDHWQQTAPEKYRAAKPEDLIVDRGEVDEMEEFRYIARIDCFECPCHIRCHSEHDMWRGCSEIFLEWATEEVCLQ